MPAWSRNQKSTRWALVMCIGFITGISHPMMAAEQNLGEFLDTRWGMTEDQVQETYPGKLERWTKTYEDVAGLPAKRFQYFGIQHYDIDECDFYITFDFVEKRLSRATVSLNDLLRLDCPGTIINILVSKYGAPGIDEVPKRPQSDPLSHIRTWFVGNTKVREVDVEFQGVGTLPTRNMLVITYEPTQTPGAKKL
jgi:hypothetical protein